MACRSLFRTTNSHIPTVLPPRLGVVVPDVGQAAVRGLAVDGGPALPVAVLAAVVRSVWHAHVLHRLGARLDCRHALRRRLGAGELTHRSDPGRR